MPFTQVKETVEKGMQRNKSSALTLSAPVPVPKTTSVSRVLCMFAERFWETLPWDATDDACCF